MNRKKVNVRKGGSRVVTVEQQKAIADAAIKRAKVRPKSKTKGVDDDAS